MGFNGYKPELFNKLGSIKGLTRLFEKFFERALQDETLSAMYKISADNPVAVENLRRKYVYFLGNFMGGNNDWHGGTLAEIHKATIKKCPLSQGQGMGSV